MSTASNKALVRRYQDLHNANTLDELDAIVAADVVSHNRAPGLPPGLEGGKAAHRAAQSAFEGLHTSIDDLIGEGDKVVARFTVRGRHTGAFMGIPPTGKPFELTGVSTFRIANGKIVEHWATQDEAGFLRQIGVLPSPG